MIYNRKKKTANSIRILNFWHMNTVVYGQNLMLWLLSAKQSQESNYVMWCNCRIGAYNIKSVMYFVVRLLLLILLFAQTYGQRFTNVRFYVLMWDRACIKNWRSLYKWYFSTLVYLISDQIVYSTKSNNYECWQDLRFDVGIGRIGLPLQRICWHMLLITLSVRILLYLPRDCEFSTRVPTIIYIDHHEYLTTATVMFSEYDFLLIPLSIMQFRE